MAYKLRGVPRAFETREQVLTFLGHSPGYVNRQRDYLRRFWPGLYAEISTGFRRQKYEPKQRGGGIGGIDIGDVAGGAVKAVARPLVEAALSGNKPQRGPIQLPPEASGALAGAGFASRAAIDVAAGSNVRKVLGGEAASPLGLGIEAAAILPFGKPLRGLRAAKAAKAAKTEPVRALDEPTAAAVSQAREGLKGAAAVRGRQEAGYSAERAKRAGRLEKVMENKQLSGVEGYRAMLSELRGELPKLDFAGFSHLTDEAVDHLLTHIRDFKHMRPYQKVRAMDAVVNATKGSVPTKSELRLLESLFGKEAARNLGDKGNLGLLKRGKDLAFDLWNLPRSVLASFDLSAPFRQGLVSGARHPVMFAKNFKPMVKAFGSNRVYEDVLDNIATRETFPMMRRAGLALTDMSSDLTKREEQFFSHAADRLPGVKNSSRAYLAFLNKMRADVFDHLLGQATRDGVNVQDDKFLKSLATYVNASTGRGDLGALQPAAVVLNSVLFSPRLMMSRFNFLNPLWYMRQDPWVRRQALRAGLQTAGAVSTVLGLASMAGARVGTDPRNADFAKIRIGNSRFDIAGGFQQPVRLMSQLASGKVISSTTGKELTLGPQGPGKLSRFDITQRFFQSKLAPSPSFMVDWFKGTNFLGEDFSYTAGAYTRLIPLLAQDAYELYNESEGGVNGIAAAFGAYGVGAFGIGFQTYADGEQSRARSAASYGKPSSGSRVSNKPSRSRSSNKPG